MSANYWNRVLLVIGLVAVFFSGKFIYVTLYSMLTVYLLARFVARKSFRDLQITRKIETDHLFRGEELEVQLEVKNASWAPMVWVSVQDEIPLNLPAQTPHRAVLALGPKQKLSFCYRVRSRHRGVYQLGPLAVGTSDPWGVEPLQGRIQAFDEVIVYPKVVSLERLGLPSSLPFGEIKTKHRAFEDPARTTGVREYQPGDPLKRMHWKVSARTGDLHVREFQPTIALETGIFLNLSDEDYDIQALGYASEFAIEVAASLAYYLHQHRQSVGLVTNGRDGGPVAGQDTSKPIRIPARKGAGQLMTVMEALARVEVQRGKAFHMCLSEEGRQLSWGSTLLVITPEDTNEVVDALFALRRSGYRVMTFLVGSRVHHPEFISSPPLPGLLFFRAQHESELGEITATATA